MVGRSSSIVSGEATVPAQYDTGSTLFDAKFLRAGSDEKEQCLHSLCPWGSALGREGEYISR